MPGTLVITTLSDGTNSTSATNCISGSAKAWVRFTGSSGAISASYNVSSVTRNGTGDYTINFTNTLADANYAVCGTISSAAQSGNLEVYSSAGSGGAPTTLTTSAVRVIASIGNLPNDSSYVSAIIFR